MIVRIIRWAYYLLFAVTPFLMYSRTSELFEFNKMMFVYAMTAIIVSLWLLHRFRQPEFTLPKHWIYFPIGLFIGALLISTLFSIDIHTSLYGYYGRFNGGVVSIIAYFLLAVLFITISDRKHTIRCLQIGFTTGILVVLWGIPGRYGLDLSCLVFTGKLTNACWTAQFQPAVRMFSTLGQPNWLGAFLAIQFCLGLIFLFRQENWRSPKTLAIALGLFLILCGVLFTRSRSGLLALGAGTLVFGIGYGLLFWKEWRSKWHPVALLAIILLLPVSIFGTGVAVVDRFIPTVSRESVPASDSQSIAPETPQASPRIVVTDSFDIRKIVWDGSLELARTYPFFGTGPETFAYAYYTVRPVEHNMTSEWDFLYNKAHNEFLHYLATTGYIGFATYMFWILSSIALMLLPVFTKGRKRSEKILFLSLLGAYISILVTNFFGFSVSVIQLWFYLLPMMALAYDSKGIFPFWSVSLPENRVVRLSLQVSTGIILLAGLLFVFRYYRADIAYARGDAALRAGAYTSAFQYLYDALEYRNEHVYMDKMSNVLAQIALDRYFTDDKEGAKEFIQLSQEFNRTSILSSPMNVLYWKTAAKNSLLAYQSTLDISYIEQGLDELEKAAELSPTDPRIYYSTALLYSLAAEEAESSEVRTEAQEQAVEALKRSISLKPDYQPSIEFAIQLLQKYERQEEAAEIKQHYEEKYGPLPVEAVSEE